MKTTVPGATVLGHATAARKESAFREALDQMPDTEAMDVLRASEAICARVSRKSKSVTISFGECAALEVLAAIGAFLEEQEVRHTVIS